MVEQMHTAGPWHVLEGEYRKNGRKFPVVFAAGEELKYIAYCDDQLYFYEPTNNLANARLIAAAPELLAAAMYAVDQLAEGNDPDLDADGDEIDPFERLRAAILKATGDQPHG